MNGNNYLFKHAFFVKQINEEPHSLLHLVVVIPCYNEPDLLLTLSSLMASKPTLNHTEVIIVINHSESETKSIKNFNIDCFYKTQDWINKNARKHISFHLIDAFNLPAKTAGVGLARKIGMDEAVRRFDQINNTEGIIICLDADCLVEENYLLEIENHFKLNSGSNSCHIAFEHRTEDKCLSNKNKNAIIIYELYLRWYKLNLQYSGHPYAFHTIGSCIAVKSDIYQKQGGMNKRKAGEDFHFLQKIFPLDSFHELNSTCVYPSARPSERVPFGTGAFINSNINTDILNYNSFNPLLFLELKQFISLLEKIYINKSLVDVELYPVLNSFLAGFNIQTKLDEIITNSTDFQSFKKRFFRNFNGLNVLQFLHYAQQNGIEDKKLIHSCLIFLKSIDYEDVKSNNDPEKLLKIFRSIERLNTVQNTFLAL